MYFVFYRTLDQHNYSEHVPTFKAMTPGDPNDVNQLILVKDCRDRNSLLQMLLCPVHLVRDASPIELHLHDVGLFLTYGQQSHLEKEKPINCN